MTPEGVLFLCHYALQSSTSILFSLLYKPQYIFFQSQIISYLKDYKDFIF